MIKLIINADDFGYSPVFNEKILDLLERGVIKSTTVMVNRLYKTQERQIKRLIALEKAGRIGVGLHIEFPSGLPTEEDMDNQYKKFKEIFGFNPSHIDLHKRISDESFVKTVSEFAKSKGLPVRNHGFKTKAKMTTHPAFYNPTWVLYLSECKDFLEKAKDGESCEIITHPGEYDPDSKSKVNEIRQNNYYVLLLLDKWLKQQKNIKVISYKEL
ncbi:MAG: ChbG/HpnK family deacetylase [Candidatus Aenigmarchaeota archaeon]|nr:ChbG/HpnK family deacetylase [Candidatus Aenigmarchaeota archaeon]